MTGQITGNQGRRLWRRPDIRKPCSRKNNTRKSPDQHEKQEDTKMGTIKIPAAEVLKKIYGETEESSARYTNLAVNFEKKYHHDKAEFFTAPGRTEIIGNHVDHNGGQIIAASIDLDTIGAAYPNGTNVIHMISEGYRQEVVVDLDKLSTETYTKGTDALVAGIME